MHTTLKTPAVLLLLVACEGTIQTNPNTLSVEPTAVSHLRGQHTVALMNAYKTETEAIILQKSGSTAKTDLKHLNTAIVMLSRAMKQQGIHVSPDADKIVTLRVHEVQGSMVPLLLLHARRKPRVRVPASRRNQARRAGNSESCRFLCRRTRTCRPIHGGSRLRDSLPDRTGSHEEPYLRPLA